MQRIRTFLEDIGWVRLALGLVVLAALAGGWLLATRSLSVTPAAVRATLAGLGVWGGVALVLALAAVLVVPVVPASLLQIGAGLAYGPIWGLLAASIADVLGASAGYWIARRWGDRLLRRWLKPETHAALKRMAGRISWRTVMLLRLLPGPAYPLVSFAAGAAPLRFGAFTVSSLLGVLPGLVLLVIAGDLALRSPLLAFAVTAALVGSLAVAGRLLRTGELEEAERVSDAPGS